MPDQPGGSAAGSTVNVAAYGDLGGALYMQIDQLRADLAAAQAEIERLRESQSRIIDGWYDWDRQLRDARATIERQNAVIEKLKSVNCRECGEPIHDDDEPNDVFHDACLHPLVERQNAVITAARDFQIGYWEDVTAESIYRRRLFDALAALDRATTEATTSQNPSGSHGEAPSRDHTDVEKADGPS